MLINCDLLVSDGPTNDTKTQFFVKINLFASVVRVNCTHLHYTKLSPKQQIQDQFLKILFSKSNQRYSKKITNSWVKDTIKNQEKVCPQNDHSTIFSLDCCSQRQLRLDNVISMISHLSGTLNSSKKNRQKKVNHFEKFNFVDTDNEFHNTNFKT